MSFYQNPFTHEFRGNWALGDRKFSLGFTCRGNSGRGIDLVAAWGEGPYNLNGNDDDGNLKRTLKIQVAMDAEVFQNWGELAVNAAAGATSLTAVTPREVITALNADTKFAAMFVASLEKFASGTDRVFIKQKFPAERMRFYIVNGQAESVLKFNARAGVAELPVYFDRHSTANSRVFNDSLNTLVYLDPAKVEDQKLIDNAVDEKGLPLNFDYSVVQEDWELLRGRAGDFIFEKTCVDDNGNPLVIIRYNAGAREGDLAKKICFTYDNGAELGAYPTTKAEIPYVLTDGDLIDVECDCGD